MGEAVKAALAARKAQLLYERRIAVQLEIEGLPDEQTDLVANGDTTVSTCGADSFNVSDKSP